MRILRFELIALLVMLVLGSAFAASVYQPYYWGMRDARGNVVGLNRDADLPDGVYSLLELRTKHKARKGIKRLEDNLWRAYHDVPEFRSVVDGSMARHNIRSHVWVGSAAAALDFAIREADTIPTQQLKEGQKLLLVSARVNGASLYRKWHISRQGKDGDYYAIDLSCWDVELHMGILKICGNLIVLPPTLRPPKVAVTPSPQPTPTPQSPLEEEASGPAPQYVFSEQGPASTEGQWIQPVVPGNPVFIPKQPRPVMAQGVARMATVTIAGQRVDLALSNALSTTSAVGVTAGGAAAASGNSSAASAATGTVTTPTISIQFPGG